MAYYSERKESQNLIKATINPQNIKGSSCSIKNVFHHYSLILEPLIYISGFHHSVEKEKITSRDTILDSLPHKIEVLNSLCLDSNLKYIHNVPNEIIYFNHTEGIKIRGFSPYILSWNNQKHEFRIKGEKFSLRSVSKSHTDYQRIYQDLTMLVNNKSNIDEKILQWIESLDLSFEYETSVDYEQGIY